MNQLGGWRCLWIVASALWRAFALPTIGSVTRSRPSEVCDDLLTGAPLANLKASREAIRARAAGQCLPASIAMDSI